MPDKLEDCCAVCPELLADGYGRCDHRRCVECLVKELAEQTAKFVIETYLPKARRAKRESYAR